MFWSDDYIWHNCAAPLPSSTAFVPEGILLFGILRRSARLLIYSVEYVRWRCSGIGRSSFSLFEPFFPWFSSPGLFQLTIRSFPSSYSVRGFYSRFCLIDRPTGTVKKRASIVRFATASKIWGSDTQLCTASRTVVQESSALQDLSHCSFHHALVL